MSSLLPSHPGLLPYWQLFMSAFTLLNATQCIRGRKWALRTYAGPNANTQVTDFGSRMFGTWTALSFVVRLYAAYKIEDESVYVLALWTYVIAFANFGMEWLGFGTMVLGPGLLRVAIVPIVSVSWMLIQWDYYVKH